MLNKTLVASLDKLRLPDDRRDAVLERILARADAERQNSYITAHAETESVACRRPGEQNPPAAKHAGRKSSARAGRRKARRRVYWLVPVAAAVLAFVILFSIPAVSRAVQDWFYDIFRADRYLYVPPGERTPDPDFETALTPPETIEQSYRILLLDETEDYAQIAAWRESEGFPAYDPAEWEWLRDVEPRISDLFYDGVDFMVMTFFPYDPLPFMSGYIAGDLSPLRLDILTLNDGTITNQETGRQERLFPPGTGLVPQKDYRNADGSANVENIAADGGVWLYTEYQQPDDKQLAPGRYTVTIRHRILDGHIDDMAPVGTVAVCEQTFVLDTGSAIAAISERTLPITAFSGEATFTTTRYAEDHSGVSFKNAAVALDGLVATPTVQRRPTGVRVLLDYRFPESWDEETRKTVRDGIGFTVRADGSAGGYEVSGGYDERKDCVVLDIPVTQSELAACKSFLLCPEARYIGEISTNGTVRSLSDWVTLQTNDVTPETEYLNETAPLTGGAIELVP